MARPAKPRSALRNPVARVLAEGRFRPKRTKPRKGKGAYRRRTRGSDAPQDPGASQPG